MDESTDDGTHEAEDTEGDRHEVDGHRERDVKLDAVDDGTREPFKVGQARYIIGHQGDVGTLYGDVAAHGSHGYTHVRSL